MDSGVGQNAAGFLPDFDDVFTRIANRYDSLCDVFSLLAHRAWKSHIAKRIAETPGSLVLDAASGTGDIPWRISRQIMQKQLPRKKLLVTDLCPAMLDMARRKLDGMPDVECQIADAHNLSQFETASVDVYSISFGMKIMQRDLVLSEARRVLKPGGVFYCLEAARIPLEFVHRAYLRYMDLCLPLIARIATSGDAGAYNYLLQGVHEFPRQDRFAAEIAAAGFENVGFENLSLGIVALHWAVRR